jgi:NADH:ubiquinone oxidoreductase subunit 6 (subunit J)
LNLSGEAIAFYLLALLVAGSAFGCVIARNIVRMALCLLGTLGGVALFYFLLSASFSA